jgi:hypothetical protein
MPNLKPVKAGDPSSSPPRPLGKHGQDLWDRILSEFAIDDTAGREMLFHACAALDVAELCAAQIGDQEQSRRDPRASCTTSRARPS